MKFVSLKKKLVLVVLLCSGASATVATTLQIIFEYFEESQKLENDLLAFEKGTVEGIKQDLWNLDDNGAKSKIESALLLRELVSIRVIDQDGKVFSESRKQDVEAESQKNFEQKVFQFETPDGQKFGTLETRYTKKFIMEKMRNRVLIILLLNSLKTMIVSFILLVILGHFLVKPIEEMSKVFKRADLSDPTLSQKLNRIKLWSGHDELHELRTSIDGAIFKLSLLFEDSKRQQEQLRQERERVATSARMAEIGALASGISHEIANPLTVITGFTRHMSSVCEETTPKEITLGIKQIDKSVDRIKSIIAGMKRLARNGTADPISPVSAKLVLENIELATSNVRNSDGVDLRIEMPTDDIQILCRQVQLEQVLVNLINNSRDAIAANPQRWITVRLTLNEKKKAIIAVTDSGSGIPEDVLTKMFTPFFTTKEVGKGTGLGLSISSSIIENNGGALHYNEKSKNTEFVITLPTAQADATIVPSIQSAA